VTMARSLIAERTLLLVGSRLQVIRRVVIRLRHGRCSPTVAGIVVTLCLGSTMVVAQGSQVPIDGTYALVICEESCELSDSSGAVVTGALVLADSAELAQQLSASEWRALADSGFYLAERRFGPVNACFALQRRRDTDIYAGIVSSGLTVWERSSDDSITVPVYRSSDAGFRIVATVVGSRFEGRGAQSHAPDQPMHDVAFVVGVRTGPPDATRCIGGTGTP